MPDILHRISIDAPPQRVHDLIASTGGIARWWTGRPLTGEHANGSSFSIYFGDAERPAAVMQVLTDTPDHVVWRVTNGPDTWIDTQVTFILRPSGHGGTTLLFTHAGWQTGQRIHERVQHQLGCLPRQPQDRRRKRRFRSPPRRRNQPLGLNTARGARCPSSGAALPQLRIAGRRVRPGPPELPDCNCTEPQRMHCSYPDPSLQPGRIDGHRTNARPERRTARAHI